MGRAGGNLGRCREATPASPGLRPNEPQAATCSLPGTGFLSDWLWLVYTVPPAIGLYYLWVKVIYPWISKPDDEPAEQVQKTRAKYSKGR